MDINDIYRKTPLGIEEMTLHKLVMKPAVRRALIMVDGMRNVEAMLLLFRDPQDAESVLNALVTLGLIEQSADPLPASQASSINADSPIENRDEDLQPGRDPAQRFMDGQKFMNNAIREHLGFKAIFFTLKIEKCGNVDDCLALLNDFEAALTKAMKNAVNAKELRNKAKQILTI